MSVCITTAGEALLARLHAEGKALVIDQFLFAHVPGQDSTLPVDPAAAPPTEHQVYVCPIPPEYRAWVNPNQVVYSALLGSDVGPFTFNWQGLYCTEHATLVAVATFPAVEKRRQDVASGSPGNNLNRNFMLTFDGARALTGITVHAGTWQLDFTVRHKGIDERERLSNRDIYGRAAFLDDGWLLYADGLDKSYRFAPGRAYVEGIRAALGSVLPVVPTVLPCDVWLDACMEPQGSDVVTTVSPLFVTPDSPMPDYTTQPPLPVNHYCVRVAHIDADGTVTDLRGQAGTTDDDGLFSRMQRHIYDYNDPHKTRGGIVVSAPVITGPASVKSGSSVTLTFTAESRLIGGSIAAFRVTHPDGVEEDVPATGGAGSATVLVLGAVGMENLVRVLAVDDNGNMSLPARHAIIATDNDAPSMKEFIHTVPDNLLQDSSVSVTFSGAVDMEGDPIFYTIVPEKSGLMFSKLSPIAANEAVTMTAPKSTIAALPVTFTVRAVDDKGAYAAVSIGTSIIGNRAPGMGGFTHNVPATVTQGGAVSVRFSGAVDSDGDVLTYSIDQGSSGLTFSKSQGISANESVTMYVPGSVLASKPVSFIVTASDGRGGAATATVNTTIMGQDTWTITSTQNWSPPVSGTYEVDVHGGHGGGCDHARFGYASGGAGGRAVFNKRLEKGEIFAVTIGGSGGGGRQASFSISCHAYGGCYDSSVYAGSGGTTSFGALASATGGTGGVCVVSSEQCWITDETTYSGTQCAYSIAHGSPGNGYGGTNNYTGGSSGPKCIITYKGA